MNKRIIKLLLVLILFGSLYWYISSSEKRSINYSIWCYKYINKVLEWVEVKCFEKHIGKLDPIRRLLEYADENNLESLLSIIKYEPDDIDISSDPAVTLARGYGDCDDYSRLAAYILRKCNFRTYIVDMFWLKLNTGHSICIAFKGDKYMVIDNNIVITEKSLSNWLRDNTRINGTVDSYGNPDVFVVMDEDLNLLDIQWKYSNGKIK